MSHKIQACISRKLSIRNNIEPQDTSMHLEEAFNIEKWVSSNGELNEEEHIFLAQWDCVFSVWGQFQVAWFVQSYIFFVPFVNYLICKTAVISSYLSVFKMT